MADLFNRQTSTLAGVFTSDRAKLRFMNGLAALVQSMQWNYTQAITRLYEVGSSDIYYVGGRTQGGATIQRVIGPQTSVAAFYQNYGDVCKSVGRNIELKLSETNCATAPNGTTTFVAGTGATGTTTVRMANCVVTGVQMGVNAQDMIISDNTQIMFSSLEVA